MTDMIERVARAIGDAIETAGQPGHLRTQRPDRDVLLTVARAAIAAMREPTKEMLLNAEFADMQGGNYAYNSDGTDFLEYADAIDHWRAMIDAALSEGDKP